MLHFTTMDEKIVTYQEMKTFQKDPEVLIIDVRDDHEIKSTGQIGGSINIPLSCLEDSFRNLNKEEFEKQFSRPKPTEDDSIVFSCRLGGRALKAVEIAESCGYKNAKFYKGSWEEWEKMEKAGN